MGHVADDESPLTIARRRRATIAAFGLVMTTVVAFGAVHVFVESSHRATAARVVASIAWVAAAAKAWHSHRVANADVRRSFAMLAAAALSWAVSGAVVQAYATLDGSDERIPTIANSFALAFVLLFGSAVAGFGATGRNLRLSVRQMADVVVVALGTTMFFVVAFGDVGPTGYVLLRTVAMLHAVLFTALVIFSATSLGYRAYRPSHRRTLLLLVLSSALLARVEVSRALAILEGHPLFGSSWDAVAALAAATFVIACAEHDLVVDRGVAAAPLVPSPVDLAIPLVLVGACAAVLVFADRMVPATFRWFAVVGLFLAVAMIVRSLAIARFASSVRSDAANHERILAATSHVEALGLLAGGLAHDFNNLLTALLANIGMLRARAQPGATAITNLELMEQSALRAADLSKRLMSLARPGAAETRPTRPNEVVERIGTILRAALPARIRVEVLTDEVDPLVMLDPGQLEQALLQLGMNAAQAIRERGRIVLSVKCNFHGDDRRVDFSVKDDGVGMSVALARKVRETLVTTRGDRGGAGLGLALVRSIVKAHAGELVVQTSLGGGSRFDMRLPLLAVSSPSVGRRPERVVASGFESILVVDDRASALLSMRASLELAGYHVVATTRPDDVFSILAQESVSLIVTDLDMPGMTGAELVERLREEGCSLPIILVTGASRESASTAAADEIVTKPFELHGFLATVRRTLDARARGKRTEVA